MKKRILSLILTILMIAGVLPSSIFTADTDEGNLMFTVKNNAEAGLGGDVEISPALSGGKYTGTLYLPGSADADKLTLSWNKGIAVSAGGTVYENGTAPVPCPGESITYAVTENGTVTEFILSTLKGSVGVEGMFLTVDESLGTIAAMNGDPEHETVCTGTMSFDGEKYYFTMKGRGNTTWSDFDKKPYNITFYKKDYSEKKKVELISGTKTKKWTITSNAKDPTCLRNKIGYDIALELGIGLPSRSVDVFMNGEFLGNYLLTPKNDYASPDDGYMVEIDNQTDVDQFTLTNSPKFTVKDMADNLTVSDVKASVSTAWDALRQSNSDEYLKYFDLDSWAKMYLLNELYKDVDVSIGSIFFTKATMDDDTKLIAGPIWDLDGTFGRVGQAFTNADKTYEKTGSGWYIDGINEYPAPFLQLLGKHESFMKRVYEIYNEYKPALENILTNLDTQSELIAESAEMNYARWPQYMTNTEHFSVSKDNTKYGNDAYAVVYQKTDSWEKYVANLKEYISKRLLFFSDKLTAKAPEPGEISGDTAVAVLNLFSLTAETEADEYQWQSSSDGKTWENIEGATEKTYTITALYPMNGIFIRCATRNGGDIINTSRVAKTATGAITVLGGVTLTVSLDGHVHNYEKITVEPTCTERGYSTYTCFCGDSYTEYTDPTGHKYIDGFCDRCKERDPDFIPLCVTEKEVSLTEGKLVLTLGGNKIGEFTFAKSGSEWTIKDFGGKYLSLSGNAFAYSESPFGWTYSGGAFTASVSSTFPWSGATTYYLVYSGGSIKASTRSSSSLAGFIKVDEHVAHIDENEDGKCDRCREEIKYDRGDANGDGVIDTADAAAILRYIIHEGTVKEAFADCNADGFIDTADAAAILRYIIHEYTIPQ